MSIQRAVETYYGGASQHNRYRSWEHCYQFFRVAQRNGFVGERDPAALQLAFYLASWGMYRGSSFLLQYAYTIHRDVVDLLAEPSFADLWEAGFGASQADEGLIPLLRRLVADVRAAYRPYAEAVGRLPPTDTLVTKVVLGTFGCLPACDRYFIAGFKHKGFQYSCLNDDFIRRLLSFCQEHLLELREIQRNIERAGGIHYPLMKLVDMYFWQTGYEVDAGSKAVARLTSGST